MFHRVDVTAFRKCANFKEFKVPDDNVYYSTDNGALYDKGKMYLYIYPQGIEADSVHCTGNSLRLLEHMRLHTPKIKKIYMLVRM